MAPAKTFEEVNAWGTYGNTAISARDLRARGRRYAAEATSTRDVLGRSCHPNVFRLKDPALLSGTMSEIEEGHAQSEEFLRLNWSRHFEESSGKGARTKTDDITQRKEDAADDGEDTARLFDEIATEDEQDVEAKENAQDIFFVYFSDGTEYYSDTRNRAYNDAGPFSLRSCFFSVNATMPWLPEYIQAKIPFHSFFLFVELCLRGIGQVYFLNNPMSGLLILIGLFVQSSRVAVHGMIALVSGNLTALMLGFDRGLMKSGLFGYNAVLVGLALATFYSPEEHRVYYAPVVIGTIVSAGFTSVLFTMMGKILVPYKSPPLTLPFNVATLMFLLATANMEHVKMNPVRAPLLPDYDTMEDSAGMDGRDFFAGVVRGVGQVFLANDLTASLFIVAGIFVCSRIAAVAALLGSAIGAAFAILTGVPASMVVNGMYGFNASLSVAAMFMFYAPSYGNSILGVLAGTITVIGQQALSTSLLPYGLPFMTLPFCVASLPFIIMQGTTSLVTAIPLATMTIPEDHMMRVNVLKNGFKFLLEAIDCHSPRERTNLKSYGRRASQDMSQLSKSIRFNSHPKTKNKRISCLQSCLNLKQYVASHQEKWVPSAAIAIFERIDLKRTGSITLEQFVKYLSSAGLSDKAGVAFVSKALTLLDLDGSGTIEVDEFVAFAMVSRSLSHVKKMNARFFNFVDTDGSQDVDFDELDAALEYLGQPALSELDRERLRRISGGRDSFDTVDIVNFVTISKLKVLVAAYHAEQEQSTGNTSIGTA